MTSPWFQNSQNGFSSSYGLQNIYESQSLSYIWVSFLGAANGENFHFQHFLHNGHASFYHLINSFKMCTEKISRNIFSRFVSSLSSEITSLFFNTATSLARTSALSSVFKIFLTCLNFLAVKHILKFKRICISFVFLTCTAVRLLLNELSAEYGQNI